MKSRFLLAGAGLLHSARAIPAYITTVYSCPEAVTITQTVYPPGWTSTGPIYTTRPLTEPRPPAQPNLPPPGPQEQCTEQGLTTSWETEYATRTVYYSEYGMYSGPPGCPPTIFAYMPTTVTCSEPQTTGWVGYAADIACASCTATTLVGLREGVSTVNGAATTYYTVFTEVYVEAGATTQASMIGGQWIATGTAPYAAPYPKQCTSTVGGGSYPTYTSGGNGGYATYTAATPTVGGGLTVTAGGSRRPYPSIDYNDPNVFRGGPGIASSRPPAENGGTTRPPSAETAPPRQSGRPTSYPIDYNDPNVFRPLTGGIEIVSLTGSGRPPSAETATPGTNTAPGTYTGPLTYMTGAGASSAPGAYTGPLTYMTGESASTAPAVPGTSTRAGPPPSGSGRPTSYPADFNDPNVFRPLTGGIEIISATGPPPILTPATTTYTVPSSFGANYNSVDFEATENFRPLTGGISIVSLNPPQSFPPPVTTSIPVTSRATANYPSIDYANPSVFRGQDPNSGGAAPASTVSSAVTSATSAA